MCPLYKPHLGVSTDTISRWLKESIGLAGIDTSNFKGHSTRSASTSKAASLGLSVKEILVRAGWSNDSTFQNYHKEIERNDREIFQKSVLKSFKQR